MVKQFLDYDNCVIVSMLEGHFILKKNEMTGLIITTDKGFGIQHEGVYVGVDHYGVWWALHNHPETGQPTLGPASGFTSGSKVWCKVSECGFPQRQVLLRAMHEFFRSEPYSVLSYNCQHFASNACNGRRESWQVSKVAKGLLAIAAVVAVGVVLDEALA